MRPSWRNTVGIAVLMLGLAAYALVVMVIGSSVVPDHALVQLVFFAVAGLAWLWPARSLLRWMARDAPGSP